jgi:hypothetical protein
VEAQTLEGLEVGHGLTTMAIKDHYEHDYEPDIKDEDAAEKKLTVDNPLWTEVQRVKEQQSEPMRSDIVARKSKICFFVEDAKVTD